MPSVLKELIDVPKEPGHPSRCQCPFNTSPGEEEVNLLISPLQVQWGQRLHPFVLRVTPADDPGTPM